MGRENDFQSHLIERLNQMIGDQGFIFPMDGNYIQGFPDVLILFKGKWAALECKRSKREPYRPNQEHYIALINSWCFASVIYPDIEDEVLHDLQQTLRIPESGFRRPRISKC